MALLATALVLILTASNFADAANPAVPRAPRSGTPGPGTVEVTGALTYNGRPTGNATSPGSALGVVFASPATVEFSWQAAGGKINQPLSIAIQTARLQVIFLGLQVWTKDQTLSPPSFTPRGSVNMTADFSLNRYLLEGLYELTGSLISPNGTSVWSESFYLKASAPDHLTATNVGLALVGLYEVFAILTVGGWVTRRESATRSNANAPADAASDEPSKEGR